MATSPRMNSGRNTRRGRPLPVLYRPRLRSLTGFLVFSREPLGNGCQIQSGHELPCKSVNCLDEGVETADTHDRLVTRLQILPCRGHLRLLVCLRRSHRQLAGSLREPKTMRSATVKAAAWLCHPDAAFHLPRASHRDPGDPPLRRLIQDDAQAAAQSKDVPASASKTHV